jgi:alkylation response protein AidB-like acyl-CoA dehydrogenase
MSELIDFAELRESARSVLTAECSSEKLHKFIDGKVDLTGELRRTMAELGWYALLVPEEHGGLGLGCGDLAAIYYELGRVCAPSDFLGSMLVAHALLLGQPALAGNLLPSLAAGELKGAAWGLEQALSPKGPTVTAAPSGAGVQLTGSVNLVVDAAGADLLLLPVQDAQGELAWVLLDLQGSGVELEAVPAYDCTRNFRSLQLTATEIPADHILARGEAARAMADALLDHACLALACDSIGGAEAIFAKTVDYLKTRKQFNRLIGSFQALKHRCADLQVALLASSAGVESVVQDQRAGAELGAGASMVKAYATDVYSQVAADAVQLHGGIGFTWEQDCHLYLKRAKLNQQLFGGNTWHRDRVARQLLQQFATHDQSR